MKNYIIILLVISGAYLTNDAKAQIAKIDSLAQNLAKRKKAEPIVTHPSGEKNANAGISNKLTIDKTPGSSDQSSAGPDNSSKLGNSLNIKNPSRPVIILEK